MNTPQSITRTRSATDRYVPSGLTPTPPRDEFGLDPYRSAAARRAVDRFRQANRDTSDPKIIRQFAWKIGRLITAETADAEGLLRRLVADEVDRWQPDSRVPYSAAEAAIARGIETGMARPLWPARGVNHRPVWTLDEACAWYEATLPVVATCGTCRKRLDAVHTINITKPGGPSSYLTASQRQIAVKAGLRQDTVHRHEHRDQCRGLIYTRSVRTEDDTMCTGATLITLNPTPEMSFLRESNADHLKWVDYGNPFSDTRTTRAAVVALLTDPRNDRWSGDRCRRGIFDACTVLDRIIATDVETVLHARGLTPPSRVTINRSLVRFAQWGWLRRLSDGSYQHDLDRQTAEALDETQQANDLRATRYANARIARIATLTAAQRPKSTTSTDGRIAP